jgi:hypothetical protein
MGVALGDRFPYNYCSGVQQKMSDDQIDLSQAHLPPLNLTDAEFKVEKENYKAFEFSAPAVSDLTTPLFEDPFKKPVFTDYDDTVLSVYHDNPDPDKHRLRAMGENLEHREALEAARAGVPLFQLAKKDSPGIFASPEDPRLVPDYAERHGIKDLQDRELRTVILDPLAPAVADHAWTDFNDSTPSGGTELVTVPGGFKTLSVEPFLPIECPPGATEITPTLEVQTPEPFSTPNPTSPLTGSL